MENIGWNGVCIEPNPDMYKKLCKIRKCAKYNVAIAETNSEKEFTKIKGDCAVLSGIKDDYSNSHLKRIEDDLEKLGGVVEEIKVNAVTFDSIMSNFKKIETIDYISIDTEGNEFKILSTIDFTKYDIKTLSIENESCSTIIRDYMQKSGYKMVSRLGVDDIYVKA